MKNNLLLINLPCKTTMQDFIENQFKYNPSLGLLAIASYLNLFEINTYVKDYNFQKLDYFELEQFIIQNNITVVGVTTYTENLNAVFKFMSIIKSFHKNIITIAGGPHATLRPEEVIKSRYVDYLISKDGESSFLEFMIYVEFQGNVIKKEQVYGLIYKEKGEIYREKDEVVMDLNLLPIINRDLADITKYKQTVTLYTSKGCPGKCIYCAASFISGAKYRMRDVENIFLECRLLIKQIDGVFTIFFSDDTFTANRKRVKQFCEFYIKYKLNVPWSCESRVDIMTEEMIDLLSNSGCHAIQFGVESGNQFVLDKIRKNIDLKQLIHIIKYISKYEIDVFTSFMIGHFPDTIESMKETISFARSLKDLNSRVNFGISINTPFPGTWQYEHAKEIGMVITDKDYSHYNLITPIFHTENFSENDLWTLQMEANK